MESVKLMNMCKIIDIDTNRVLIQERLKNWYNEEKNERSIVFLYQTKNFTGNLISETEEGKNYWISEEELLKKELANNFDIMLKVFTKNNFSEMIYNSQTKDWDLF